MRLLKRTHISYIKYCFDKRIHYTWLRRAKAQFAAVLYVLTLFISPLSVLFMTRAAQAAAPYAASAVIGQPDFTKNAVNAQNPSSYGLKYPAATALVLGLLMIVFIVIKRRKGKDKRAAALLSSEPTKFTPSSPVDGSNPSSQMVDAEPPSRKYL